MEIARKFPTFVDVIEQTLIWKKKLQQSIDEYPENKHRQQTDYVVYWYIVDKNCDNEQPHGAW